jgi:hypothetical protein
MASTLVKFVGTLAMVNGTVNGADCVLFSGVLVVETIVTTGASPALIVIWTVFVEETVPSVATTLATTVFVVSFGVNMSV